MKLVNKSNIPEVLFNALCHNWYSGEGEERDWSITELLDPSRIAIMKKRHDGEIVKDAITQFWSMLGSVMHEIVEKGSVDKEHLDILVEKRVKAEIDGKTISGGLDVYNGDTKTIIDFKYQTVFNWIYLDDRIDNLTLQLNAYRYLLMKNGYEVKNLQVIFIFRDWREYEVAKMSGYPETQFKVLPITVMPDEEIEKELMTRINLLSSLENVEDKDLPLCTMKERWQNEDMWKIMFKNKCIKTFYSEQEAYDFVEEKHYGTIKFVKGVPKRCEKYCSVNGFCEFYQNIKNELVMSFD